MSLIPVCSFLHLLTNTFFTILNPIQPDVQLGLRCAAYLIVMMMQSVLALAPSYTLRFFHGQQGCALTPRKHFSFSTCHYERLSNLAVERLHIKQQCLNVCSIQQWNWDCALTVYMWKFCHGCKTFIPGPYPIHTL